MINGEGAEEKPTSAVASPFDPPRDRESDGGDELSDYSSCGGESEFERYCSANSAMGTPSFCGSSYQESDFGSLKSFKLGFDNTHFKISQGERVLYGYRESESGTCPGRGDESCSDGKDNGMLNLNGKMEGIEGGNEGDLKGDFGMDNIWGNEVMIRNRNYGNSEGGAAISSEFRDIGEVKGCSRSSDRVIDEGEGFEIGGGEDRNLSNEDEASLRYEHSDGDDSMFGCGSDDERKMDMYCGKNLLRRDEESRRKENQLVMNSAVAYGSNDWDDFVEESRENAIGSMVWDGIQADRQSSIQTGFGSLSFTAGNSGTHPNMIFEGRRNEIRSTPAASNQFEAGSKSVETNVNALSRYSSDLVKPDSVSEDAKGAFPSSNQVSDIDELTEYLGRSSDIFQINEDRTKKASANEDLKIVATESEMESRDTTTNDVTANGQGFGVSGNRNLEETNIELAPDSESVVNHRHLVPVKTKKDIVGKLFEDENSFVLSSLADTTTSNTTKKKFSSAFDQIEDHFVPDKKVGFLLKKDFLKALVDGCFSQLLTALSN